MHRRRANEEEPLSLQGCFESLMSSCQSAVQSRAIHTFAYTTSLTYNLPHLPVNAAVALRGDLASKGHVTDGKIMQETSHERSVA